LDKPEVEASKKDIQEAFGLMFRLGDDGVYIIPLTFEDGEYISSTGVISHINQDTYSPAVMFVNYYVENKVIFTEPLSSMHINETNFRDLEEFFGAVVEDKELRDDLVLQLHNDYRVKIH
jgi:hypothetical protein